MDVKLFRADASRKTYATVENAQNAVARLLKPRSYRNTFCTVIVTAAPGSLRRFIPICVFQGEDRVQACIDTARSGFISFA